VEELPNLFGPKDILNDAGKDAGTNAGKDI
jgi:hypothetical protein